jgi:hypothetical protein
MKYPIAALAVVTALAGCDGNPFVTEDDSATDTATDTTTDTTTTTDGGTAIVGDITLPPGTVDPTAAGAIFRSEETGTANNITYDAATDTISINNLPFDGDGTYDRDNEVGTLNGFSVYENNNTTERRAYKTLYGVSASGETRFAITRTGDYRGYGFGGFVYQRDVDVALPTTGSATFTGDYAGLRVFDGTGGIQYTTADAIMEVDFEDFDANDAVEGTLINRQVYETDGSFVGTLPVLIFATGSISDAGEIAGTATSEIFDIANGEFVPFETGNYYAILSGDPADEIVGIIVVEGEDPNDGLDDVTIQETGGFILTTP